MVKYSYKGTDLNDYNLLAKDGTINGDFDTNFSGNDITFGTTDTITLSGFPPTVSDLNYKINGTDIGTRLCPTFTNYFDSTADFVTINNKYTKIRILLVGGGGGGGGSGSTRTQSNYGYGFWWLGSTGGGGGAGGVGYADIDISTGGYSYKVTIGNGGTGGTGSSGARSRGLKGNNGDNTTITIRKTGFTDADYIAYGGGGGYGGFSESFYGNFDTPPSTYEGVGTFGDLYVFSYGKGGAHGSLSNLTELSPSVRNTSYGYGYGNDGVGFPNYLSESQDGFILDYYGGTTQKETALNNPWIFTFRTLGGIYKSDNWIELGDSNYLNAGLRVHGSGGDSTIFFNQFQLSSVNSGYTQGPTGTTGVKGFARVYFFP